MIEMCGVFIALFGMTTIKSYFRRKESCISGLAHAKSVIGSILTAFVTAALYFLSDRKIISDDSIIGTILTFVALIVLYILSNCDLIIFDVLGTDDEDD